MIFNLKRFSQGTLLALVILFFSLPIVARDLDNTKALADYIGTHCKKKCVNPDVVLMAVQASARNHGVSINELLAIMRVESAFNPKANNQGSVGLMQVNLKYHARSFRVNPYDVFANVDVGASVYKACLVKRKGNVAKALRCYNGEGAKNMIYPNKVLKTLADINKLFVS